MASPLHVIVLAAGEGKRMKSALPKVLMPLAGRPMLAHVIDVAHALGAAQVHVVHGHGGDAVRDAFAGAGLAWAHQAQQLGTGHAVLQALPSVPDAAQVLVLYGDVPLITVASLRALLAEPGLALLADELADPAGYGRVILDGAGRVAAIVEHKDASDAQRAIRVVNTGVLAAPAADLKRWLAQVGNRNSQGEYYLTDVYALAAAEGRPAACARCGEAGEADGANDPWQLAQLERRAAAAIRARAGARRRAPGRSFALRPARHGRARARRRARRRRRAGRAGGAGRWRDHRPVLSPARRGAGAPARACTRTATSTGSPRPARR